MVRRLGCCFISRSLFYREVKDRPLSRSGLQPDPAAMALDDLAHEGQPDAGSLLVVVLDVEPLEDPENLLVEFRGDADAVVLHVEDLPLDPALRPRLVEI